MTDKIVKDAQYLSGRVYNNGEYTQNLGYQLIEQSEDLGNGFYSEAYYKNGKIILTYRGTDTKRGPEEAHKDLKEDYEMWKKREAPSQYINATLFYKFVERKYPYQIYVTGHSLGGSLAQMVGSSIKEVKAITFNALGTGDCKKFTPKYPENVTNYGNAKDAVFSENLDDNVGKVYMIGEKGDRDFYPKKYHQIKDMGDLDAAKEYIPNKQSKSSGSRKSYRASATGNWVTINGNHVLLKE